MEDKKVQKSKKFRQYADQDKQRLQQKARNDKKKPDGIFVVVQCHPKCRAYENLPEYRFIVNKQDKIQIIDSSLRKKVTSFDKKFANQSVFMFSQNKLLNIETSIEQIYSKHKNFKDNILYLYYADVQAF